MYNNLLGKSADVVDSMFGIAKLFLVGRLGSGMGSPASRRPGNILQTDKRPGSSDNGVFIVNPHDRIRMWSPHYPNRSP